MVVHKASVAALAMSVYFVIMNSTEVQNPRCKLDVFGSVLACAKSDHVFQKLSYLLCGLCLSLSSL